MPAVTIYTTKDASAIDNSGSNWSGSDDHHPVGRLFDDSFTARSVIYFPISFSGIGVVTSAVLWLRGSKSGASHASGNTSNKTMFVRRQGVTWKEDTPNTEGIWSNRENNYTTLTTGDTTVHQATKNFGSGITDGTWYSIDITEIVNDWKTGSPNYGVLLVNDNQGEPNDGIEFYAREKGAGYKPYLIITYSTGAAPNAPTTLNPNDDETWPSLKPVFTGAFSDPDAGDSMSGYQIQVYEDDGTTLLWDTGTTAATTATFSKTYNGPALDWTTFYKWKVRTKDASGAWGPYSSLQRFQTADTTTVPEDEQPDPLSGLSASAGDASITLDWTATDLDVDDFDHYAVYRREFGTEEWEAVISLFNPAAPTYEDLTPEFGVTYEYKVTQFKNITGGFDVESGDSEIVQVELVGESRDAWSIIGADGLAEHAFDLPVTTGPIQTPIQQEVFEPLGSSRKTVVRGRVLGSEGVLTMQWDVSERELALTQIRYIVENRGPHVLRSPFGDVWLVEFSGPDREDLPLGHLVISLAWTEVA